MQALSLDAAGTLFDLAEPVGQTYASIAASLGLSLDADLLEANFRKSFPAMAAPDYSAELDGHEVEKRWWRNLVLETTLLRDDELFDRFFAIAFAHYETAEAWQLYPDTISFLEAASKTHRLAVLSNFDARLHTILRVLGLSGYFEVIVSSAEARARKPDPAAFRVALERLNLSAGEVLHIGDSRGADYEGALAAGLPAFLLNRPEHDLFACLPKIEL